MKKIKIFIGSSVDKKEFEIEREKLGSFINGLNREYIKRGIFVDLYDCETVSNKMRSEGSQKQHDDYIKNEADATFFMFFKKAGEFTLHELQVARDALVNKNRPDIFTYFKVVGDDIEQTDEIKKAVDVIANSYGHYFSKFTDADTIKLAMLQYIVEKLNDGSSVTINDATVYVNNTKIDGISIDNIFAYQNNTEYKKLQQDIDDLTVSIDKVIENKQFDNIESLTVQKEEKEKLLAKLENDILNMLIKMQKELKKGNTDPICVRAYQLLEMGKIKEAQALFPIDVLKAKSKNLFLKNEILQQENADIVEYAKIRIEALNLDVSNPDRFKMIEDTYETVIENAFICYDNELPYDFSVFLYVQNKSQKAYEVAKRLEGLYLLNGDKFEKFEVARLYNILGSICEHLSLYDEQEDYYLKAIKIREILAKNNSERFNPYLANSYNNVGVFYDEQGKPNKAEDYFFKAIEIYEDLVKTNPERFNPDLAMSYNNAGAFYNNHGNPKKAESYYLKAIGIREDLVKTNPERFNLDLAMSYNNAGVFYDEQGKPNKAEDYFLKAIGIREDLVKTNPERFNLDLASSYNDAGNFYSKQGKPNKAEDYYLKAIEICEDLSESNPARFNPHLATSYNNAGAFYKNHGNPQKAESFYLKAIGIREDLVKTNLERFNLDLASSYNNAGVFYDVQGNPTKAEDYYLKAIKIREDLSENNPDRFNPDLADSYNNAGAFYSDQGNPQKAEEYYLKAIKIREGLVGNNPDRFNPDLADSYINAGIFYSNQGNSQKAEDYYLKAIKIREDLAINNADYPISGLAISYYNYAALTKNKKYFYMALKTAQLQPNNPYCKEIIDKLKS